METPFLHYPVRQPINQTNLFGANPDYYQKNGLGLGHPGNDFECPSGTPVYAPCDGAAFYVTDKYGGCGIYIRTPDTPNPKYDIILWHLYPAGTPGFPYAIPTAPGVVTDIKAGQLLAYSDNSGFPRESSGPHLHLGVLPINASLTASDPDNGYGGCIDPAPYYTKQYAQDIAVNAIVQTAATVAQAVAAAPMLTPQEKVWDLQAIWNAIISLFKGRNNTP